ncbi:hypothetical protein CPB85DRAFT_1256730 [Mucidula mucida]|nr:hypothetical protein CPB85DRAFT_1256730 [Mucidula mucida]
MLARLVFALAAAASAVSAFEILAPNSATWWVAESENVFTWTCTSADAPTGGFTVLIGNQDTSQMAAPQAIVAIGTNADCSKILTPQQVGFSAGTGYLLLLADPFNNTHVYATSEPFEIQAKGSAYPTTTAAIGSATGSGASGSSTGSAAASSQTNNGALKTSVGLGFGAIGALLGMMTF